MAAPAPPRPSVFLNCPFVESYERLFVALIAGSTSLGLVPRSVLEVSGSADRLRRLYELIRSCDMSIHDLSFVQLNSRPPRVPRFNMPFELGLAAALSLRPSGHRWLMLERRPYRLQVSLSDVNGYDPYVHGGTPRGMLEALANAFVKPDAPSVPEMIDRYRETCLLAKHLRENDRLSTLFAARPFRQLVVAGASLAEGAAR